MPASKRSARPALPGLAAVLVLGAAFYGWTSFQADAPAPMPVVTKPKAAAPAAASTTPTATAPNTPAGTPSETLNKLANVPANAVQKARNVIDARNKSGQTDVAGVVDGLDLADKPAVAADPSVAKAPVAATGSRAVAPGISATTALESGAEASAAFRSFVANARIGGAVPDKAMINGKLTRIGETVDATLGITFGGYSTEKNQLLFKDRTGASVARRYP